MGKRSGRSKKEKTDRFSPQPFNLQYCVIILVVVLIACGFSSNNSGAKQDDEMRFKEEKKEDCKFPTTPIVVQKVKVAGNFTRVSNLTLIEPITVPVMSVQECGIECNNMVPPCTGITYIAQEELPDHCIMSDRYAEFGEEILEDHPYFDPHMGHFIVAIGEKTMPTCYRSMDDIHNVLKRFIRSSHVSTSTPFTSTARTSSATPTSTSTTTSSSIETPVTTTPKTEKTTAKGVKNETVSIGGTTSTEKPKGGGETKTASTTTTTGSSLPNTTTTTTAAGTTTTTGPSTTTTSSSMATTTTSPQTTSQQPSSTTTPSRPSCTIRVDGKNMEISEGDEKKFDKNGGKTVRYVDAGSDSVKNGGQAESTENLGDPLSSLENVDSPTVVCIANVTRQNGSWIQLDGSHEKGRIANNVISVRCNCSFHPTTTTQGKAADPTTTTTADLLHEPTTTQTPGADTATSGTSDMPSSIQQETKTTSEGEFSITSKRSTMDKDSTTITGTFPTTDTSIGTTVLPPKTIECAKIHVGKDEFEVREGMDFTTVYAAHLVMFTGSRDSHISVEVSPSCQLTLTMIDIGRHPVPKTFNSDLDVDMENYRGFKDAKCSCEK